MLKRVRFYIIVLSIAFSGCVPKAERNENSSSKKYPNPFSPSTRLYFDLLTRQFVNIKMYDVNGKELLTLMNDTLESGKHNVMVDTTLPSGVYFIRLKTEDSTYTKKCILLK